MRGFVDLHCHWVHQIDDGARTLEESRGILEGLVELGFSHVVATPHIRPGMFDNDTASLHRAYERTRSELGGATGLPQTSLGSEHFFDEWVLRQVAQGRGLPYRQRSDATSKETTLERNGGAILLEFLDLTPLSIVHQKLFELQTRGYVVVIAHPERYRSVWKSPNTIADLVDRGAITLLDTAALVGKYGRRPKACAKELLDEGLYHAACSDAHRPADVKQVRAGMQYIEETYGESEIELLFRTNPSLLLQGKKPAL